MVAALDVVAGDPGRLHAEGRRHRVALEEARASVAELLGARPREVVFTSGGTEAVNTAVTGAVERARASAGGAPPHAVVTAVEHSSVGEAVERAGADVSIIGVDGLGRYDPATVLDAVRADTALVSIQSANHEVGTRQPWEAVAAGLPDMPGAALLHLDACAGVIDLVGSWKGFIGSGVDLCSVTAHKSGGPAGTGALLVRRGLRIAPMIVGGAQERDRRAGLENVVAATGFGALATELSGPGRLASELDTAREQTSAIERETSSAVEGVTVFGDSGNRLGTLVCFGVEGVEAEPILLGLDQRGVAAHSGSSCSSEILEPSPVLAAMGVDADHSLRVSVGWNTSDADVALFLEAFPIVVDGLRSLRPPSRRSDAAAP